MGALTLFLLDKEAKLSCLLLQRPLELDPHRGQISDHTHGDDLFAARCLLALGLVTLYLLRRLPRVDEVSRHWRRAFAWAAGTALAGV